MDAREDLVCKHRTLPNIPLYFVTIPFATWDRFGSLRFVGEVVRGVAHAASLTVEYLRSIEPTYIASFR